MVIPFNKAYVASDVMDRMHKAQRNLHTASDGAFTGECQDRLQAMTGSPKVILTHTGTHALELAAILSNIGPGDEVIMPSYTFVSTANAFVLRGAVPVFVDIQQDTLNVDPIKIELAVTKKTKLIVPVHYAGVAADMRDIMSIADKNGLLVVEDAAQGIGSSYHGKPLGSIGTFGALSFHETKNVSCGEGGALLINENSFIERAEVISQKGTDRKKFLQGQVDKYTWKDIGSSYMPSDLTAAYLSAQLVDAELIRNKRIRIWQTYQDFFSQPRFKSLFGLPGTRADVVSNGHIYYLLAQSEDERNKLLKYLNQRGVGAIFHFIPLHQSEAGKKYARVSGELRVTEQSAKRLLRLPVWAGMSDEEIAYVCDAVAGFYLGTG